MYGLTVAVVRGGVDEILRYAGYGADTVDRADVMGSAGGTAHGTFDTYGWHSVVYGYRAGNSNRVETR